MKKLLCILLLIMASSWTLYAQKSKIDSINMISRELFGEKLRLKVDTAKLQTYYENDEGEMVAGDQIWWKEFIGTEVRSNLSLLLYGKLRNKDGKRDDEVAHNWTAISYEKIQEPKIKVLAQLIEDIGAKFP
ncbi:hypothetical protein [Pedobacter gandavensis]|uniref:hypothetical protein n=1 Tax=Pedobacter gandavensis TaxID=2679963 RepID=UPI0029310F49|nr:hypothetical protein [Pedobacter gandavensis]